MSNQKFESEEEDSYFFTITNVWWSDSTDIDGDFYTSARKINFDVKYQYGGDVSPTDINTFIEISGGQSDTTTSAWHSFELIINKYILIKLANNLFNFF